MENRGYLHVYTGDGKGKTTAAFGLAVRALCAGRRVYIGQFVKSMQYSETKIGELFFGLRIEQLGRGCGAIATGQRGPDVARGNTDGAHCHIEDEKPDSQQRQDAEKKCRTRFHAAKIGIRSVIRLGGSNKNPR